MNRSSVLLVVLALAACSPKPEAPAPEEVASAEPQPEPEAIVANAPLNDCAPATGSAWCGVSFGSSPDAAKIAFKFPLVRYTGDANAASDPNACYELLAEEPLQGVSFLVEQGAVGRVDVISEGPKTADGFGVGSTEEAIRTKYGSAVTSAPNKYEPEVLELTVTQPPGKIIFEIQDGSVRAWRAGIPPLIDYVERCG
jgi:hypothetical protein